MQIATLSSKNAPIELAGIINRDPGHGGGEREHERVAAPIGDRDSAERCDQRKKQAFGEKLLDQTAASGAEREAHGHFMSAQSDRARRRLLTFAQAIRRTKKTTASVMPSVGDNSACRVERRFPQR